MAARARARTTNPAPAPERGRKLHRLAFLAVGALLVLVALVFDPRVGGQFRLVKALAAQTLGLASLLLLALGAERLDPEAFKRALASPVASAVAPLLVVATLLSFSTRHPEHVARGLAGLWLAGVCLLGWSWGFERRELARLLTWTLPGAVLSALLGFAQATGLYQPFSFVRDLTVQHERFEVIGFAGNPGDLSAALVLPCLWAQAAALAGGGLWPALAAGACALGILATQTVTSIAALAVGSALIWLPRLAGRGRRVAVAGLALGAIFLASYSPARERVISKLEVLASGDWNEVLSGRLDGWRVAVEMLAAHPFTGVGQGAYRAEFVDTKEALVERGVAFYERQPFPVFANAHSEPLEVAAEAGLPGLLALGWALWVIGARLAGGHFAGEGGQRAFARAGVAGLAVLALVGFPFRVAVVGFPAMLFLAWLLADEASAEAA